MVKHDDVYAEKYEASKRAAERMVKRLGLAVERLDVWTTEAPDDEHYIVGINIKVRYDTIGDVLIIVKARGVDGDVVAFQSADTISAAVAGLVARLDNGQIKWREDTPWSG